LNGLRTGTSVAFLSMQKKKRFSLHKIWENYLVTEELSAFQEICATDLVSQPASQPASQSVSQSVRQSIQSVTYSNFVVKEISKTSKSIHINLLFRRSKSI
jgi:hypothetical protein